MEYEVQVGGRKYRFRPTIKTVTAVERALGEPSSNLGFRVARAQIALWELALIVSTLIRVDDPNGPDADAVGEMLIEDGINPLLEPLAQFLLLSLRGNKEHAKEAAAARDKENPPASSETT